MRRSSLLALSHGDSMEGGGLFTVCGVGDMQPQLATRSVEAMRSWCSIWSFSAV
jgi:hypothetical protein